MDIRRIFLGSANVSDVARRLRVGSGAAECDCRLGNVKNAMTQFLADGSPMAPFEAQDIYPGTNARAYIAELNREFTHWYRGELARRERGPSIAEQYRPRVAGWWPQGACSGQRKPREDACRVAFDLGASWKNKRIAHDQAPSVGRAMRDDRQLPGSKDALFGPVLPEERAEADYQDPHIHILDAQLAVFPGTTRPIGYGSAEEQLAEDWRQMNRHAPHLFNRARDGGPIPMSSYKKLTRAQSATGRASYQFDWDLGAENLYDSMANMDGSLVSGSTQSGFPGRRIVPHGGMKESRSALIEPAFPF